MNENFGAHLSWYRQATRTKLKVQWTQADYADIESSDDEQTSYDLATRAGTQVEPAPIVDRVVMSTITPSFKYLGFERINICFIMQGNVLKQSMIEIEQFPRTGVDDHTLNNFLGVSRH